MRAARLQLVYFFLYMTQCTNSAGAAATNSYTAVGSTMQGCIFWCGSVSTNNYVAPFVVVTMLGSALLC
jgi:hypothetical protein